MGKKKEDGQPKTHAPVMDQLAVFKAVIQAEVAAGNMDISIAVKAKFIALPLPFFLLRCNSA
jgi:hypothetical protein